MYWTLWLLCRFSSYFTNYVIELVLAEAEKFGNAVGSINKDIVSNYQELDKLQLTLSVLIGKSLREFVSEENEETNDEDEDIWIMNATNNNDHDHNHNINQQNQVKEPPNSKTPTKLRKPINKVMKKLHVLYDYLRQRIQPLHSLYTHLS